MENILIFLYKLLDNVILRYYIMFRLRYFKEANHGYYQMGSL